MAYRLCFRFVSVDFVRLCPITGYRNYTQLHSDSTIRSKILKGWDVEFRTDEQRVRGGSHFAARLYERWRFLGLISHPIPGDDDNRDRLVQEEAARHFEVV